MNVEVKPVGACRVNVNVSADSSETRPEYKAVLNTFIREGQIKGFRKGKAPVEKILQNFGAEITKETVNRLCRKMYSEALEQSGVKLVQMIGIHEPEFAPEMGMKFTIVADIEPEFKLAKYKGIAVKAHDPVVTEDEVDAYVERMRQVFAKFEETQPDYVICAQDLVSVSFKATTDGKPLKEVVPEAEQLSEREDFWFQVREDQFIPEIVEAVTGMRCGDQKTVKVKFPKDHQLEQLQGCKAIFDLTVKAVRQQISVSDEELCKQVKTESLEEFRKSVRERMQESALQEEMVRRKNVVIEHLLKKNSFDVPESELREVTGNVLDQMMRRAQYEGVQTEDLASKRDEIVSSATQSATNQLRIKYILREIAANEKLAATDDELQAKMEELAVDLKVTTEELSERLKNSQNEKIVEEQVIIDKAMDFLLQEAK